MNGVFLTVCLSAIIGFAVLAKKLKLAYPIVFVIGGIVLALTPGVPDVRLAPDTVFLLFLPPLIFGDGWMTDFRAFRRYAQSISSLAVGLVVATSVVVAVFAHRVMGLPLGVGFLLGAILSPTDAVATDAVADELGLPRRLSTIISGESLVNDATGLVIYRFAVVAAATGAFSLLHAFGTFLYSAAGGIALGVGIAWLIALVMVKLRKHGLTDPVISVSISLVTPFALYVPADALGMSGVLAAMSGAIFLSLRTSTIFAADDRLEAAAIWQLLFFVFNGAAFVLIGLQLRTITRGLATAGYTAPVLLGWSVTIALLVIAVRYAWVMLFSFLRNHAPERVREREGGVLPFSWQLVAGTAGMRGVVSLAAALAIPETVAGGGAFPFRDLLLFVTFVVILITLVGQGLMLPVLIRRLGVIAEDDGELVVQARRKLDEAARARLRELEPDAHSAAEREALDRFAAAYDERIAHASSHAAGNAETPADQPLHAFLRSLVTSAARAERAELGRLRRTGAIDDVVYRRLESEIDLAESREAPGVV